MYHSLVLNKYDKQLPSVLFLLNQREKNKTSGREQNLGKMVQRHLDITATSGQQNVHLGDVRAVFILVSLSKKTSKSYEKVLLPL